MEDKHKQSNKQSMEKLLSDTDNFLSLSKRIKKSLDKKGELTLDKLYDMVYVQESLKDLKTSDSSIRENAAALSESIQTLLDSYTDEQINDALTYGRCSENRLATEINNQNKKVKMLGIVTCVAVIFHNVLLIIIPNTEMHIKCIAALLMTGVCIAAYVACVTAIYGGYPYGITGYTYGTTIRQKALSRLSDEFVSRKYARRMKDKLWNVDGVDLVRTAADIELHCETMKFEKTHLPFSTQREKV